MDYNKLELKQMWVEKLEDDLKELETIGIDKNSKMYQDALERTKKAQDELKSMQLETK